MHNIVPANNIIQNTVSVALAVYNGSSYLPALLASLNKQTVQPFELVVLNDSSTDNSLEIINNFPLAFIKKVYSNTANSGPNFTFKKLAGLCTGNFIAFCDQDDIWLPDKIEKSLSAIKEIDTNVPGIAFSDLSVINEEDKLVHHSFWKLRSTKPANFNLGDILFGNIVTGCASVINRAMAYEMMQMPVNVIMYDYWLALIAYSFGEYKFINEPLILYRAHGSNITDKSKASAFRNFLNDLKNKPVYLEKNIQQAAEFNKRYANRLNYRHLKTLKSFIALQHKPFFYKRVRRDTRSLLRRFK